MKRKIFLTVDGEGENIQIAGEDGGCTVALVHIAVQNDYLSDQVFPLQDPNSNGGVIEHTISFAMIRIGVMCAASQVCGQAILKSSPASPDCAAYRKARALDQLLGPWKTNSPHFFIAHLSMRHPLHVIRGVDQA